MKITTKDIQVGFHARRILKGISIESKDKDLVGIIGPNGSGKSTFSKILADVLPADRKIRLEPSIGYLPQKP